jgi:drug/metabolite transporter (DMT)-like permease
MIVLGTVGMAASNFFYYLAIQRTNVATAIILQYTAPLWVLLYTAARAKRWPTAQQILAVFLALIGIALLINLFGEFRLDHLGLVVALIAAFSFAFYNVAAHSVLARYDRWIVILYVTGSAAAFWMLADPPWKIWRTHYSGGEWAFLIVFAIVSALLPFLFYAAGLQHLEPTRAMIASCTEPVFTIAIAAVALGELMGLLQFVGILVVLVAILVVEMPGRRARADAALVEPIE